MNINLYSEEKIAEIKHSIDKELATIQDSLLYFKSSVIKDLNLEDCYQLNSQRDGFIVDTTIDASLTLLIKQTIRLCLSRHI